MVGEAANVVDPRIETLKPAVSSVVLTRSASLPETVS